MNVVTSIVLQRLKSETGYWCLYAGLKSKKVQFWEVSGTLSEHFETFWDIFWTSGQLLHNFFPF